MFQFPSNGKVDPNSERSAPTAGREVFQFPSNGKVDPNSRLSQRHGESCAISVSIPFKRESGS